MNSHGDPYRDFRFWVYSAAVRPFNLGKGDYRAYSVNDICSHYEK